MIPNALASTGAYADFWSNLKSMDYALERCMDRDLSSIGELDKDRLDALVIFLRENFISNHSDRMLPDKDYFFQDPSLISKFIPDFDLIQRIKEVSDLKSWHSESKIGLEKKIEKLIIVIEDFSSKTKEEIFKKEKDIPTKEFIILRKILSALLLETQPALYL